MNERKSCLLALLALASLGAGCAHPTTVAEKTPAAASRAPASVKNWRFDYAKFYLDDVVNAKSGKSVLRDTGNIGSSFMEDMLENRKGYRECRVDLAQRDVAVGHIVIYQYSDETYIRSFRQIRIENIQAKVEITGLNLQCHMLRVNSSWSIRNLAGKQVADIFGTKYKGGKLGVSVGVSVAVNLNESVVVNGKGVTITNMEQMLDAGNLGVGVTIGYHAITFDQSNLRGENQTISISHSREDGTKESETKSTFEEAMKLKL